MAEIETGKLKNLEAKAAAADGTADEPTGAAVVQKLPEPYRTIMMFVLAAIGFFGGGAAGQSVFGISQDTLDKKLGEQRTAITDDVTRQLEVIQIEARHGNEQTAALQAELRELRKTVQENDRRITKVEAGK